MAIISWFTTALCLIGTVLNVKKLKTCFVLWLIGNALWFGFDIYNGVWSRAILDTVQFILAGWGLYEWSNTEKE